MQGKYESVGDFDRVYVVSRQAVATNPDWTRQCRACYRGNLRHLWLLVSCVAKVANDRETTLRVRTLHPASLTAGL